MNRKTMMKTATLLAAVGIWVGTNTSALASLTLAATGSNPTTGQGLAASVTFSVSGNNLLVSLANVGDDIMAQSDLLTALFFSISGSAVTLTPVSAYVAPGSTVNFGPNGPLGDVGNVGGEWAYAAGINGPRGATMGISSSGFSLFGSGNFNGPDLQPPPALDGAQYGLSSLVDNLDTGNSYVAYQYDKNGNLKSTPSEALIQNAVNFVLVGLPAGFDLGRIEDVNFQYGTGLTEPNIAVPEPSTYIAGGLLLIPLLIQLRRWKRSA